MRAAEVVRGMEKVDVVTYMFCKHSPWSMMCSVIYQSCIHTSKRKPCTLHLPADCVAMLREVL